MHKDETLALFRHNIISPLINRKELKRGELKRIIKELASHEYTIPYSDRCRIGKTTIEGWYYDFQREGFDSLKPKKRSDKGASKIPQEQQEAIIRAKKEQPGRSIDQVIALLEGKGDIAKGELHRSSVHRLLQRAGLSRIEGSSSMPEEFRSFEMLYAGQIWFGDVMHGPAICLDGRMRKVYLVSLMDDASRMIMHSAFCLGEKAVDIEGVLKQAVLKRGLPHKLVLDNGSAYRSGSLNGICARLGIHMIFCRPYAPEGKGKLERWHRTFRNQFLQELDISRIESLGDLNARLWAWLEEVYHVREHSSLNGLTPKQRYLRDIARIRMLGTKSTMIDDIFYHRVSRKVRRDGSVHWQSREYEVDYKLAGFTVELVIDPHEDKAIRVENKEGEILSTVVAMDRIANGNRTRRKPEKEKGSAVAAAPEDNMVEAALDKHRAGLQGDQ